MINIKSIVASALVGDDPLVILLGGEFVYRNFPSIMPPEKLIVYGELDNEPLERGDEKELFSEVLIQLDVCVKEGSTSDVALAVDRVMTNLGGVRVRAPDDDDSDPEQIRIMVYRFVVEVKTGEIL